MKSNAIDYSKISRPEQGGPNRVLLPFIIGKTGENPAHDRTSS
jgi:hypothetical protein